MGVANPPRPDRAMGAGTPVDLLVLGYHALSPTWESFLAVEPRRLQAQVKHLLRRGYRPKSLSQALREGVEERTLVVTFDDGYRSILELGLPALADLGVPATVFVPTDLIDDRGLFECLPDEQMPTRREELRCMSWEEVGRLAAAGWEIGSHTCSHPHLPQLDAEQMRDELIRSKQVCEDRLQRPCESIAYPYGSYDERVVAAAAAAGYQYAVTLEPRLFAPIAGRGPLDIPREGIFRETRWPKFLLNTSRTVRRVRLSSIYDRLTFGRLRELKGA